MNSCVFDVHAVSQNCWHHLSFDTPHLLCVDDCVSDVLSMSRNCWHYLSFDTLHLLCVDDCVFDMFAAPGSIKRINSKYLCHVNSNSVWEEEFPVVLSYSDRRVFSSSVVFSLYILVFGRETIL